MSIEKGVGIPYFRDVIGHHDLIDRLRAYRDHDTIPHSILFIGEEGSEAMPIAFAFARYIQCKEPKNGESCGHCTSCLELDELSHPDVHLSFPIAKTAGIETSDDAIDKFRTFIKQGCRPRLEEWIEELSSGNKQLLLPAKESDELSKKLAYKSYQSQYRVVLMWLPERMHVTCANKILKLLEEPPSGVIFLMVTSDPDRILTTIYSRLQRVIVSPLSEVELTDRLQKTTSTLNPAKINEIAHLAQGNYKKALDLIANLDGTTIQLEEVLNFLELPVRGIPREYQKIAENIHTKPREEQTKFMTDLLYLLREVNASRFQEPSFSYIPVDIRERVDRLSPYITIEKLPKIMSEIDLAIRDLSQNVNTKIVVFDLLNTMTGLYHK